jgi:hypothetical protein
MVMVNRKSIRLLTAWVLAAALLAVVGSDALAARPSKVWGLRTPAVSTQPATASTQAHKPGIRPMSGEPDTPATGPSQLPYWQLLLQGLLPILTSQRMP